MGTSTGIAWTDATWNPIRGCARVSEGCRYCYAEKVAARFSGPGRPYAGLARTVGGEARWTGKVAFIPQHLEDPLRWTRPRRIFVNSMSDLFHEAVSDVWLDRIFAVMRLAQRHTFQVLTKRPDRMRAYLSNLTSERIRTAENLAADGGPHRIGAYNLVSIDHRSAKARFVAGERWALGGLLPKLPLPNVWLGVSVEDQATAESRIPLLLQTPAAVRWVSAEPLLGPLDLRALNDWLTKTCCRYRRGDERPEDGCDGPGCNGTRIDWLVVGGESGGPMSRALVTKGPRRCWSEWSPKPEALAWARALRDQCQEAGVPFFFKQWGGPRPDSAGHHLLDGLAIQEFPA